MGGFAPGAIRQQQDHQCRAIGDEATDHADANGVAASQLKGSDRMVVRMTVICWPLPVFLSSCRQQRPPGTADQIGAEEDHEDVGKQNHEWLDGLREERVVGGEDEGGQEEYACGMGDGHGQGQQ